MMYTLFQSQLIAKDFRCILILGREKNESIWIQPALMIGFVESASNFTEDVTLWIKNDEYRSFIVVKIEESSRYQSLKWHEYDGDRKEYGISPKKLSRRWIE